MVRHAPKPKKKKGVAQPQAQPPATAAPASASASGERQYVQQVSKKGEVNALSTAFLRESDAVVAERKLRAQEPFGKAPLQPLSCKPSGPPLGLPLRPPVETNDAPEQAARPYYALNPALFDSEEHWAYRDLQRLAKFNKPLLRWQEKPLSPTKLERQNEALRDQVGRTHSAAQACHLHTRAQQRERAAQRGGQGGRESGARRAAAAAVTPRARTRLARAAPGLRPSAELTSLVPGSSRR